jgi:hypothetical protein
MIACSDKALEVLELNHSKAYWEDMDVVLADMDILEKATNMKLHIGATLELHNPTTTEQSVPTLVVSLPDLQSLHVDQVQAQPAERVDIPDQFLDTEDTPQMSPRLLGDIDATAEDVRR